VQAKDSNQAILFDAGEDPEPILRKIADLNLELKYLVNTHGHGDHIAGNQRIVEETGARLLIHQLDQPYLSDPYLNLSAYFGAELISPPAFKLLQHGIRSVWGKLISGPAHSRSYSGSYLTVVR